MSTKSELYAKICLYEEKIKNCNWQISFLKRKGAAGAAKLESLENELHNLESSLAYVKKLHSESTECGMEAPLPERWKKEINWHAAAERWNTKSSIYRFFNKKRNPIATYEKLDDLSLDEINYLYTKR